MVAQQASTLLERVRFSCRAPQYLNTIGFYKMGMCKLTPEERHQIFFFASSYIDNEADNFEEGEYEKYYALCEKILED